MPSLYTAGAPKRSLSVWFGHSEKSVRTGGAGRTLIHNLCASWTLRKTVKRQSAALETTKGSFGSATGRVCLRRRLDSRDIRSRQLRQSKVFPRIWKEGALLTDRRTC